MPRRTVILLIVVGGIVFLALSALLTRALSVGGAEDAAITDLVRAESRGDASAVIALVHGCHADAACRARAAANAAAFTRAGSISIVQIQPSAGFSLTGTVGTARVVFLTGTSLPRVQCVRVRRAGSVFDGFTIEMLRVSRRITTNARCPARY